MARKKKRFDLHKFTLFAVISVIVLSIIVAALTQRTFDTRSKASDIYASPTPTRIQCPLINCHLSTRSASDGTCYDVVVCDKPSNIDRCEKCIDSTGYVFSPDPLSSSTCFISRIQTVACPTMTPTPTLKVSPTIAMRVKCNTRPCSGGIQYKDPLTGIWSSCFVNCTPMTAKICTCPLGSSYDTCYQFCVPTNNSCTNIGSYSSCTEDYYGMYGTWQNYTQRISYTVCQNDIDCYNATGRYDAHCGSFNRCYLYTGDTLCLRYTTLDRCDNAKPVYDGYSITCVWDSSKKICLSR